MPVRTRHHRHRLLDLWFRHDKRLAVEVVEFLGEITGNLEVLFLILPHRHTLRVVKQDVGSHEHGIRKEAVGRLDTFGKLVLVAVASLDESHRSQRREYPHQFDHLRHIGLPKEDHPLWVQP